jgi:hypothetical protein
MLKVKELKKIFQQNEAQQQAGVAILTSDKQTPKLVRKYKGDHFIPIKGTIHQEVIIIINIYTVNVGKYNFIKEIVCNIMNR